MDIQDFHDVYILAYIVMFVSVKEFLVKKINSWSYWKYISCFIFNRLIFMFVCFVVGETMKINCSCVMDVMTAIIHFV